MAPPECVTLVISMINEHGQHYEDSVPVSISTRFYIWFKYLLVTPVIMMAIPLLSLRKPAIA